jgi:hypothetical protein
MVGVGIVTFLVHENLLQGGEEELNSQNHLL